MTKRILALLLCGALLFALCIPAFATESEQTTTEEETEVIEIVREQLSISNKEEFLTFAENCRLDSYSRYLDVKLTADIDLQGQPFGGVPHFSGTFNGGGYTISGVLIEQEGSVLGLFRYLTETAKVKDLHIKGTIQPAGSRCTVGALAGSNAGLIEKCSFDGQVAGLEQVGGLVGINLVTGVVDTCAVKGEVYGDHFVGGITGENQGVIRFCVNNAQVNTTPQQNSVEIGDITMDSLRDTEAANTVTDVGGIAGTHTGVLRSCANYGDVGYKLMGYNIGGIAGSQSGYIVDCENRGSIFGRKEVGGIVGQAEPVTKVKFAQDTLQILEEQLDTMSALTNRAAANAQSGANSVTNQITVLQNQVQNAMDAVETLMPDESQLESENPQDWMPDEDTLLAAENNLSSAFSNMQGSLSSMAAAAQSTANTLSSDLQAVAGQVNTMGETVGNASENLGGTVTDASDSDTEENTTGKIQACVNYGSVEGDINIGGIAGTIALENDLDQEEDVELLGETSLNFESELRAVVLECRNEAQVTGSKQYVGGIIGRMQLGLVKGCESYGPVGAESADYVGGVAGQSMSFIRFCSANAPVTGGTFVGGIAGSGTEVTQCRTIVLLTATEKSGNILGGREDTETENPVAENYYLCVQTDNGGIDGISYEGVAQSLSLDELFALEDIPQRFHQVIVTFLFESGEQKQVVLEPGQVLQETDIPQIPHKEGYTGYWKDLAMEIPFDATFRAVYDPYTQTLQSDQLRGNGLPVLLAVGGFTPEQALVLTQTEPVLTLEEEETLLEAWVFTDLGQDSLRYQIPEGVRPEQLRVLALRGDVWQEMAVTVSNRYVVLDGEGVQGVCLVKIPQTNYLLYAALAGGAVVLIVAIALIAGRAKKKKSSKVLQKNDHP